MSNIIGKILTNYGISPEAIPVILKGINNQIRFDKSDAEGNFTFDTVPAGKYTVTVVSGNMNINKQIEIKPDQMKDEPVVFQWPILMSKSPLINFFMRNAYIPLKYGQYIFLAGVGIYFFCALIVGKLPELDTETLISKEAMRGAITYLIAVTTISMAALLMLASIMIGGQEVKERLALGKEILTLLIGILGTIIGFYYGSVGKDNTTDTSERNKPTIAKLQLDPIEANQKGSNLIITSQFKGGTPPYSYTLSGSNLAILARKEIKSKDGRINESQSIPDSIEVNQDLQIIILGLDANGQSIKGSNSIIINKK